MDIDPVKLGVMWQKVEAMDDEVKELRQDVKALLELANKSKGGFWMGMVIASGVGGMVTYFTSFFFHK